jgi:hypothetical protein
MARSKQRYHGTCRHCGVRKVTRPRGLCWRDFYDLSVREQYPPTGDPKYQSRGVQDFTGRAKPPSAPTVAPPGSPEKVAVLCERARAGVSLWHSQDSTDRPKRRRKRNG